MLKLPAMPVKDWRFSPETLLNACLIQESTGHAGMDQLLQKLGIDNATSGRGGGGLRARASALAQFVLKTPDLRIDDDVTLGVAIVRHAIQVDPHPERRPPAVKDHAHQGFWKGLAADGYVVLQGQLTRSTNKMANRVGSSRPHSHDEDTQSNYPPDRGSLKAVNQNGSIERTDPFPPLARVRTKTQAKLARLRPRVFVVHGRDNGLKHEVARFLEKLGLDPVILHERPNDGRTLLTKFRQESEDVHFAIVLMTPDDVGGLVGEKKQRSRARQNVVFELGFFIGKLGPSNVCALVSGDLERPSDFDAVVYVKYETNGAWKNEVARELSNARVDFDPKALIR